MPEELTHLAPEESITSTFQPVDLMVSLVAALIGGDTRAEEQALKYLDRAADWMNMSGVYLFRIKDQEYKTASYTGTVDDSSTVVTITDGAATLNLPSDWGWPHEPNLVYDLNGNKHGVLEWVPWAILQKMRSDAEKNSIPEWISIKSELDDTASIFPPIEATQVGRIKLSYITRVQRPSEVSTLSITPETREALIAGGEAFVMRLRYATKPNIWQPFWTQFENSITLAKAAAARREQVEYTRAHPDEVGRLPTGSAFQQTYPRGSVKLLL